MNQFLTWLFHRDDPEPSYLHSADDWDSVKTEVGASIPHTLFSLPSCWRCLLDLSSLEPSDALELSLDYQFLRQSEYADEILPIWVCADRYIITLQVDARQNTFILINGTPTSLGKVITIESLDAPFLARLTYKQTHGISKTIRYMILEPIK